ncbi:MAG: nickel-cobalt-cadmium resistance protein nccn [Zetaproteobacteria bacterium CG12_big_fil_rev_8_21_14_0_65_54_13]|nr:MAG: nickel-cobalt-cadmium resistance protein nccn [Zetaproteobacteria bacterium CG23_combo_of_CG06-09_8_20_14_all_54_7]PIW44878.1 MAG: nickel-cobalt-cadmium resistance protein nccn [Zetaproteobacteria bacterium CG12_big_fil_rev_8_21_14_0_65_54_13]
MNSELTSTQRLHKALLRARIPASILMGAAILLLAHPTMQSWAIGLAVITLGESLRIWASGYIHKSAEVTSSGPYAMCRHPLYLGHFIIATGFCLAADSLAAFIIVTVSFLIIYMPTWKNEEQNLIALFGDTYRDFMATRFAILPRWSPDMFSGEFSWEMVKKHREWNHVMGLAAGAAGMIGLGLLHGTW